MPGMDPAFISSMRQALSLSLAAFVAVTALASSACATKTINHVLADPSRYRDREIKVSGTVVDSYSVGSRGAYQIEDGSGRLWVLSDQGVPRRGARVTVTGTIREGFNLGALGNLVKLPAGAVVMVESSHRARDD